MLGIVDVNGRAENISLSRHDFSDTPEAEAWTQMSKTKDIWTVSELNDGINSLLSEHYGFLWVEGEVSNLRRPASGHIYFTLKDEKSQIRAVLFRAPYGGKAFGRTPQGGFDLEDGMHIACRARLTVYSPRGEYQLIVERVEPQGLGALQKAYEQLKARLQSEGLFDTAHKKEIPYLPGRIGVITSPTGAVIRDILHVTARRFPGVHLVIAPVRVQGSEAPDEIIAALKAMNARTDIDVIILARGGGSFEDLHPFNTEAVARALFASAIPVISAIGHETDVTISDFVADLRAPTPSAAAELSVPLRTDLLATLSSLSQRLSILQHQAIEDRRQEVADLARRLKDPRQTLADRRLRLGYALDRMQSLAVQVMTGRHHRIEQLSSRLHHAAPTARIRENRLLVEQWRKNMTAVMNHAMERGKDRLLSRQDALNTLNPLAVLQRGYSLTTALPEGWIVREAATVAPGQAVRVRLARGAFQARIIEVYKEDGHGQG